MFDLLATWGIQSGIVLCCALLWRFALRKQLGFRNLFLGFAVLAVYYGCLFGGLALAKHLPLVGGLTFPWIAKGLGITTTLIITLLLIRAHPRMSAEEIGLTWRQRAGFFLPCLIVTAMLCGLSWGLHVALGASSDLSPERLAYQATLPGLDEELFFRGLFAAVLSLAFKDDWNWAGAKFGLGPLMVTFCFAAAHGLLVIGGKFIFSPFDMAFTGALGLGLLWIRRRSGSLLPAVLAHNLVNLGNSFF